VKLGRLASYTQQLHKAYLSITALTLTPPLRKSAECTSWLFFRELGHYTVKGQKA